MGRNVPKFTVRQKVYWGLCNLGTAMVSGIYAALLPIFYQDYLGLIDTSIIIYVVSILYMVWNAFNDPIFGFLSDRTKSKKGRRIPFMRYTAPFLGLFFVLVWFAPAGAGDIALFWWMLITMLLYDTAYTIIGLVYSALLPEITEDEQERNGLNLSASFFYLIGTIVGFLLPDFFRNQPGGSFLPLQLSMIAVAVVVVFLVMFTSYKFKERPEFTKVDEPLKFWDSIRYTFKNKAFLIAAAANFMSVLMQSLLLGSIYYMADFVTQTGSINLLICVFIPLILGVWLSPMMIKRFGVVRSDQIFLIIGGIGLFSLTFVPVEFIYLCLVFAGLGIIGPLQFTNLLFAQIADDDELKSGVRREAAFFGTNALLTKPAQSLALAIPTALLVAAAFLPRTETGGIPRPDLQPDEVFTAIRVFIGLIPGIALLLEAMILQFYPLKGEYLKKIQDQILVLHSQKHAKLEEMEKKREPDRKQQ
jgi:GPH family glycoside/pentoside/hexuronide:cation symporter